MRYYPYVTKTIKAVLVKSDKAERFLKALIQESASDYEELISTEAAAKILDMKPNSLTSAISREQIVLKKYKLRSLTLFSKKEVLFWKRLNKIATRLGKENDNTTSN